MPKTSSSTDVDVNPPPEFELDDVDDTDGGMFTGGAVDIARVTSVSQDTVVDRFHTVTVVSRTRSGASGQGWR